MSTTNKIKTWILCEERPKPEIIEKILGLYAEQKNLNLRAKGNAVINPIFNKGIFAHLYRIDNVRIRGRSDILLKIVSGDSSFVDFLIYEGIGPPSPTQKPILVVEETKTGDIESRNTGIFQRASKFVFIDIYYPTIRKIMLYNLQVEESRKPTDTNIFGTKLLLTIGVEMFGKSSSLFKPTPFKSIKEVIEVKNKMRKPPRGNVPILIKKTNNAIYISGRLIKSDSLSHDPNIGALTLISKTLRILGWKGRIIITHHGLKQRHVSHSNKFILIANALHIELEKLEIPKMDLPESYWKYENKSEKLATILLHMLSLRTTDIIPIYENHAGCERGYLYDLKGNPIVVHKYIERNKRKGIVNLPDLVLRDDYNKEIYSLEGKITAKLKKALKDLKTFLAFETECLKPLYPSYKLKRGIVLYGKQITNEHVIFVLTEKGEVFIFKTLAKFLNKIEKLLNR